MNLSGDDVSFLMPVAGAAPFLGDALRSIAGQTIRPAAVVVVADGPTPWNQASIQKCLGPGPALVFVQRAWLGGVARALNDGLACIETRYVARLDSDDVCLPHRVGVQLAAMEADSRSVVSGSWCETFGNGIEPEKRGGPVTDADCRALLYRKPPFVHPSVIFSVEAARIVGNYSVDCRYMQDYEFWMRLAMVGHIGNVPEVLLRYRIHPHQHSSQTKLDHLERARIRRTWLEMALKDGVEWPRSWLARSYMEFRLLARSL